MGDVKVYPERTTALPCGCPVFIERVGKKVGNVEVLLVTVTHNMTCDVETETGAGKPR